jgi:hypothetical protein
MADFDNTNRGSIFRNEKKTEDRHPDMSGSINIDGIEYWISGWKKQSKAGTGFISLSVRPKEQVRQSSQPTSKAKADDFLDIDF